MTISQWVLIAVLAVGTFAIRDLGLLAGDVVQGRPAPRKILQDLPDCLVVALVASSLAGKEPIVWLAAAAALAIAAWTNHVVATMIVGTLAFAALQALWSLYFLGVSVKCVGPMREEAEDGVGSRQSNPERDRSRCLRYSGAIDTPV